MTVEISVIAIGLAFPEGPVVLADGSVLVSEMAAGRVTRVTEEGVGVFATLGGGPNGLALSGNDVLACQSGGSTWGLGPWPYDLPQAARLLRPVGPPAAPTTASVQRISTDGVVSDFATTFLGRDGARRPLVRPSDICSDGGDGFYLTDGGTTRGRSRELTGLIHGSAAGELREIFFPLEMPNGIALSAGGTSLYVAETRTRRIWEFDVTSPGEIAGGRGLATVPSGGPLNIGGADGICVDPSGCIVVATLGAGGITVFEPDGRLLLQLGMDDPMTTNVVVDQPRDRLLVTLASTGRLVSVEGWSELLLRAHHDQ